MADTTGAFSNIPKYVMPYKISYFRFCQVPKYRNHLVSVPNWFCLQAQGHIFKLKISLPFAVCIYHAHVEGERFEFAITRCFDINYIFILDKLKHLTYFIKNIQFISKSCTPLNKTILSHMLFKEKRGRLKSAKFQNPLFPIY